VSPALSTSFAAPAAYGDQITALLAIIATIALTMPRCLGRRAGVAFSTFGAPLISFMHSIKTY
jgi:hypothetical protein